MKRIKIKAWAVIGIEQTGKHTGKNFLISCWPEKRFAIWNKLEITSKVVECEIVIKTKKAVK